MTAEDVQQAIEKSPELEVLAKASGKKTAQPTNIQLDLGSDIEIARCVRSDLEAQHGQLVHSEGEFWRFVGTHWAQFVSNQLRLAVHCYDGACYPGAKGGLARVKLSRHRIDSVLSELAVMISDPEFFDQAATGINCASGFIRFDESGEPTIESHDRDYRKRHVLPGRWPAEVSQEQAEGSLLSMLLGGSLGSDPDAAEKINLLGGLAGAAALGYGTKLRKPKAIIFKGETADNGKSQILDIIRGLLPKTAVASVPPGKFGDQTFTPHLVGKLLNASDELSSANAIASDAFKSIITGEPVTGRDVYKSATMFRPIALHIFAANNLPSFSGGMDRGVKRRLLMLTFNRPIPLEEQIKDIGKRVGEEEPDLLLDWAVEGASRLIKQGGYTEPESSRLALTEWMLGSDPVQAWLDTVSIRVGNDAPKIRTRNAYKAFREWAIAEGFRGESLPAINTFSQRVTAARPEIRKIRPNNVSTLIGLDIPGFEGDL